MATKSATGYEVLVDELTVHRDIGELRDPVTKEIIGTQQGQGKVYFKGEVIPAALVGSSYKTALEDSDHPAHESVSRKLRATNADQKTDLSRRLGLPFDGYDDMSEDEIVGAMANLPSVTVQSIKEYEAANENRSAIVEFSVGFGETPGAREAGEVGSDLDAENSGDSEKAVSDLTTREITDKGVRRGEGITGTGDPEKAPGSTKIAQRRQRRARAASSSTKSSGSTSNDSSDSSKSE